MMNRTTEEKLQDALACEERAWAKVAKLEDEIDDWVKKLNSLSREMDELAGSVHPSMAADITAALRGKFRALAQGNKVVPNKAWRTL
jgi:hypothetical protein